MRKWVKCSIEFRDVRLDKRAINMQFCTMVSTITLLGSDYSSIHYFWLIHFIFICEVEITLNSHAHFKCKILLSVTEMVQYKD